MPKAEALLERLRRGSGIEQPATHEPCQRLAGASRVEQRSDERRIELAADDRRALDCSALARGQPVEARGKERAQRPRQPVAAFIRVREELLDEERVALRALRDRVVDGAELDHERPGLLVGKRWQRNALHPCEERGMLLEQLLAGEAKHAHGLGALRDEML